MRTQGRSSSANDSCGSEDELHLELTPEEALTILTDIQRELPEIDISSMTETTCNGTLTSNLSLLGLTSTSASSPVAPTPTAVASTSTAFRPVYSPISPAPRLLAPKPMVMSLQPARLSTGPSFTTPVAMTSNIRTLAAAAAEYERRLAEMRDHHLTRLMNSVAFDTTSHIDGAEAMDQEPLPWPVGVPADAACSRVAEIIVRPTAKRMVVKERVVRPADLPLHVRARVGAVADEEMTVFTIFAFDY
jgi:hypothetical protein